MRAIVVVAMKGGCVDCGFSDIRALDFDHVRGDKIADVGSMIRRGRGIAIVRAEIAKCEVRCRNCPAIATMERLGNSWHVEFLPVATQHGSEDA
jgi:hypothetical protein